MPVVINWRELLGQTQETLQVSPGKARRVWWVVVTGCGGEGMGGPGGQVHFDMPNRHLSHLSQGLTLKTHKASTLPTVTCSALVCEF